MKKTINTDKKTIKNDKIIKILNIFKNKIYNYLIICSHIIVMNVIILLI